MIKCADFLKGMYQSAHDLMQDMSELLRVPKIELYTWLKIATSTKKKKKGDTFVPKYVT